VAARCTLAEGEDYTLTVAGATNERGLAITPATITFTTAKRPAAADLPDSEAWRQSTILAGLELDEWLIRFGSDGAASFLPDALGSPVAVSDAAGAITTQLIYDPFGGTQVTGPTATEPAAASRDHRCCWRDNSYILVAGLGALKVA